MGVRVPLPAPFKKMTLRFLAGCLFVRSFLSIVPMAQAASLTWTDCIQETARKNPDLHAAKASLKSAEYQTKGAVSGFLPQVSGSLNYNYGNNSSSSSSFSSTTSSGSRSSFYSTSLTATENLFSGFQDKAKIKQGKANEEASRANLNAVKSKVSFDLKSAFASLLYAQGSLKLAQEIIHRREENLNLIQLRYENGRENKGSLLLSKAYLQQAKYDALQAKNNMQIAQEQLAKVLGNDEPRDIHVVGNLPIQNPPDIENIKELTPLPPDYQQAVAQKKSAKASLTTARSPFFPSLAVTGTMGKQGTDWFPNSSRWSVGGSLTWPFFSGGKDYYATKSASANLQATVLNEESVGRQTRTKLEQGLTGFTEAVEKLKTDQSFLEASVVREEIGHNRYENGLLSFEDWDIIENDLIARQKQALQSQRDRIISEANWEQAQGKGVLQ